MRFEYRFVDPKQKEEIREQNASVITELLDTVINETALEASIELNSFDIHIANFNMLSYYVDVISENTNRFKTVFIKLS